MHNRGMTKRALGWSEYVALVVGTDRQTDAAHKTGIDQTTISRWLKPETSSMRRTSQSVRAFARGYGRPVLEAFVVAGFLTEDEAGVQIDTALPDLGSVASHDLIAELDRRLNSA